MSLAVHDERLTGRVGAATLLLLAATVALLVGMQRCSVYPGVVATVYFEHVGPLREGADVQVAGGVIGRVLSISLVPAPQASAPEHPLEGSDGVAVRIRVQERFAERAPVNGTYFISAKGIVGERYVEIGPPPDNGPRGRPLRSGDQLRGVDAPHLDRALWQSYLSLVVTQRFLGEIRPETRMLVRAVDELTATLDAMDAGPSTRALMASLDELDAQSRVTLDAWHSTGLTWSELVALGERTQLTLARTRGLIDELSGQTQGVRATLARIGAQVPDDLLDRLGATLDTVQRAIERTERTVAILAELMAMVERGQGTAGALLRDPVLFDEVKELGRMLKNRPWRVVAPPPPR